MRAPLPRRARDAIRAFAGTLALAGLACLATTQRTHAHDAPGEYFLDNDPGPGAATPLPPELGPTSPATLATIELPLPARDEVGLTLGLRFRNTSGDWGPTTLRRLFLLKSPAADAIDYTWGRGFSTEGTGTAEVAPDGTATLPRPAVGAPGATSTTLRLRPHATAGLPAAVSTHPVFPMGGATPQRLFYALDQRPDPTTARSVDLDETHRLAPAAAVLDLGSPAPGFHSLHLRVVNAVGDSTDSLRFLHVTPARVETLVGLSYVFRHATGPDTGDVTAIEVLPLLASESARDLAVPVPAALAPGAYTLLLNLVATDGDLLAGAEPAPLTLAHTSLLAFDRWASEHDLSGEAADMLADPDSDGFVNLVEYAMGGAPDARQNSPLYTVTGSGSSGQPEITVRYRQLMDGTGTPGADYTAGGIRYTVEASTDLLTWRPYNELALAAHLDRDPTSGGVEFITLRLNPSPGLDRVFVRLKLGVAP